jgi:TRAP-type uncharacterized transport system substrate-binding protein
MYWDQLKHMAQTAPWWSGVNDSLLANISGKIHPGAVKFYQEVGYPVAQDQQ